MNNSCQQLLEAALRRSLNADEEARLRTHFLLHPEDQAAWDEEMALQHALRQLPNAPLSSNFTAQVLAAVDREERSIEPVTRSHDWLAWLRGLRWTQATAMAAVILCVGLFSYQHVRSQSRVALAKDLQVVSSVAKLPSVDMLKDFDAINSLSQAPRADLDLLAAFAPEPR